MWTGKGIQSLSTPQPLTNNHLACLFFPLFNLILTVGRKNGWTIEQTDGRMDGQTDKASHRVASLRLKQERGKEECII